MTSATDTIIPAHIAIPSDLPTIKPNPGQADGLMVEHVADVALMGRLGEEWQKLEDPLGTPLLTHNWISSCATAFSSRGKLEVILVRADGELRAIAPMSLSGKFRKRMEILGSSITNEPGGFLFSDEEALAKLLSVITDAKVPMLLKGIRFASPESRLLEKMLRSKRVKFLVREESLPWVATGSEWESFEKQISSGRRSSFRRLQRLAESKGEVEFQVKSPPPNEVDVYLKELFGVEAASWKGRTGTAMKSYEELGAFFRTFSLLEAADGRLRLFFLRVNGTAIAGQLTVEYAGRLWVFKIGHDEAWSWCSPGILLMNRVIKYCCDEGLEGCELLGSDEPWLHIWANDTHTVLTYRIYTGAADAMIDLTMEFARHFSYELKARIAKRKRTRKPNVKGNAQ